jgi:polyribonucleotide nucleotidyltransferase
MKPSAIAEITAELSGKIYEGQSADSGLQRVDQSAAWQDGLLHISQIAHERVEGHRYLKEGQIVKVKVMKPTKRSRQVVDEGLAGSPRHQPMIRTAADLLLNQ